MEDRITWWLSFCFRLLLQIASFEKRKTLNIKKIVVEDITRENFK